MPYITLNLKNMDISVIVLAMILLNRKASISYKVSVQINKHLENIEGNIIVQLQKVFTNDYAFDMIYLAI